MTNKKNVISVALGSAFVASLAVSPLVNAAENPFSLQSLNQGFLVADNHADKAAEGKCAGMKDKAAEGKCAGMKDKAAEGKCAGMKDQAAEDKGEGMKDAKAEGEADKKAAEATDAEAKPE